MKASEITYVFAACIVVSIVAAFSFALQKNWLAVGQAFLFGFLIVLVAVISKKIMSNLLDADAEHKIWEFQRYGVKGNWKLPNAIPAGVFLPLIISLFSLGLFKLTPVLTYETKAKKYRAAKRFGYYSYTEMTEWHNALIGATGIVAVLALAVISYFIPSGEVLAKLSAYYAFSNMIPWSNLDGAQIAVGSKVLYITLAVITLIFFAYALLLSYPL